MFSPLDFDSWIAYLSSLNESHSLSDINSAYTNFLSIFPFSSSQWIKYAQLVYKITKDDHESLHIYRRAVEQSPYSPALWHNYITLLAFDFSDTPQPVDVMSVITSAGTYMAGHPDSDKLWALIIHVVSRRSNLLLVLQHYAWALSHPSPYLESLWNGFDQLERTVDIRDESISALGYEKTVESDIPKVLSLLKTVKATVESSRIEWRKRASFEAKLNRREFLGVPLPSEELVAWHTYISAEQGWYQVMQEADVEGNESSAQEEGATQAKRRVVMLFERCISVCAAYPEMWKRYALWAHKHCTPADALRIIHRGVSSVLRECAPVHLFYATLLESAGALSESRQVYISLLKSSFVQTTSASKKEGDVEIVLRAADFERRVGNWDKAVDIYDEALESSSFNRGARNSIVVKKAMALAHRVGISNGIRVALNRGKENGTVSPESIVAFSTVFKADSDLILVKCIYDMLLRFDSSEDRDKKVWALLSSSLVASVYGPTSQEDGELIDPSGTDSKTVDRRTCASSPAIVQLLKCYSENHCIDAAWIIEAESLVDVCSTAMKSMICEYGS